MSRNEGHPAQGRTYLTLKVLQVAGGHEFEVVVAQASFGICFQVSLLWCDRSLCDRPWSRELTGTRVTGRVVGEGAMGALVACVCPL